MSPTRARGVWWTMATQKGGSLPGAPSQLYRAAPMAITDRAPRAVQPIEPFHLTPCTSRTEDGCQFGPGLGGNRHLIRQGFVPETPRARVGDIGWPGYPAIFAPSSSSKGFCRRGTARDAPGLGIASNGVVAALIAEPAQLLEDPDQRQPLARRLAFV